MKKNKKRNQRILGNTILVICILGVMTYLGIEEYKEKGSKGEQKLPDYTTQNIGTKEEEPQKIVKMEKVYQKEEIPTQYKGYEVGAKLVIPTIQLETYVLQRYSVSALNVAVTKFWGVNANQKGNFCIAGHNFKNRNMFYHVKELKIGDRLFITDPEVGKIEYEIYDIYQVLPEDVNCLSQDTQGAREVTLITCTNDSEKRIIVKAKEIE